MTKEEVEAVQQRTREAWAKYQEASKMPHRRVQHYASEAARQEELRQIAEAQANGAPF